MKTTIARLRTNDLVRSRAEVMRMRSRPGDSLASIVESEDERRTNGGHSAEIAWTAFADPDAAASGRPTFTSANVAPAKRRIERARSDERSRLARELHDGVLQWLTGASLQLETLLQLLERDPEAARSRLRQIKELIVQEQAVLRSWIHRTEPGSRNETVSAAEFSTTLTSMCERVEWQWGLRVTVTTVNGASLSRSLAYEIHRLVQEALSNVARHAAARSAAVQAVTTDKSVRIVIQDDGHGFPFLGRYDLAALNAANMGPRTLKDRVVSLGGDLELTSTQTGSRIEISLPLNRRHARTGDGTRHWR